MHQILKAIGKDAEWTFAIVILARWKYCKVISSYFKVQNNYFHHESQNYHYSMKDQTKEKKNKKRCIVM
jgi:hypothetical protein